MRTIFAILILTPIFLLSQNSKPQYPRCLLITKHIAQNIETLSKDSLQIFFEQFSLEENKNNVEFAEWGNEILFEVLDNKPELFFNTLFKMQSTQIRSIEDEINSPISDGINMIKLYKNVENSSLDKKTKSKAILFIKPVKLHTLLDLRGNIPSFIKITDGKAQDVKILDELIPEAGSFYIMDRGYIDFERLYKFQKFSSFFVIRAKSNFKFRRIYSRPVDKSTGLKCDQTIALAGYYPAKDYPEKLRRIKYHDSKTQKTFVFLTNKFNLSALTVALLYKSKWQIELFFKWIKQHLKIKSFYGTSENAVKTQIWIAITTYLLVAIVKKQLKIQVSLYTFLQILSVTVFEQTPILQVVTSSENKNINTKPCEQLNLFA